MTIVNVNFYYRSYNFSASPAYTDLTPPDSNNYNEDDEDSRNSSEYPVRSAAAQVCHELKIEELKQKYYRIKDVRFLIVFLAFQR